MTHAYHYLLLLYILSKAIVEHLTSSMSGSLKWPGPAYLHLLAFTSRMRSITSQLQHAARPVNGMHERLASRVLETEKTSAPLVHRHHRRSIGGCMLHAVVPASSTPLRAYWSEMSSVVLQLCPTSAQEAVTTQRRAEAAAGTAVAAGRARAGGAGRGGAGAGAGAEG